MRLFRKTELYEHVTWDKFLVTTIVFIYFCSNTHLLAQNFPLTTSKDGKYITTKKGDPLLINGRLAGIFENFVPEINNLPRYQYMGINAACVALPNHRNPLDQKGKLSKNLRKDLKTLKRFTREAAFYNIAVFVVHACEIPPPNDVAARVWQEALFKTLRKFKNVCWLLDSATYSQTPHIQTGHQLKGLWINSQQLSPEPTDCRFIASSSYISTSKPFLFLLTHTLANDSSAAIARHKAYGSMLKGASGILPHPETINSGSLYNPISSQLKQLKNVLDTLPWIGLTPYPEITDAEVLHQHKVIAFANKNSSLAVVYIPAYFTLPLHLNGFSAKLRFSWINPVSGKEFKTIIEPDPENQLFLPPLTDGINKDWLLIIRPL